MYKDLFDPTPTVTRYALCFYVVVRNEILLIFNYPLFFIMF